MLKFNNLFVTRIHCDDGNIKNIKDANNNTLHVDSTATPNSTDAYTKNVPTNALGLARLNSFGGKSIVWNQVTPCGNFTSDYATYWDVYSGTGSVSNGVLTVTGAVGRDGVRLQAQSIPTLISGHKYYVTCEYYTDVQLLQYIVNSHYLNTVNTWTKYEEILSRAEILSYANWDTFPRTTGTVGTFSLKNCICIDLTRMFGAGNEPSTVTDERIVNIQTYLASHPEYNAGEILSANVTSVDSKDSDNQLISSFPIPQAVQNLDGYGWSAGSIYNEVNLVTKKFIKRVGRVDLGSLTWEYVSAYGYMVSTSMPADAIATSARATNSQGICSKYTVMSNVAASGDLQNKELFYNNGSFSSAKKIVVYDTDYTDPTAFKASVSGIYLYYRLDTPVETDISQYFEDNVIEVESGGTVTFTNANLIQVPNNETFFIAN